MVFDNKNVALPIGLFYLFHFYDQFLTFLYIWTINILIHFNQKRKFEFEFS